MERLFLRAKNHSTQDRAPFMNGNVHAELRRRRRNPRWL